MPAQHKTNDWYKDAIIYELHIKAFADSNNDGIGDFRGLISKLDYLQELGITAIWLLPFYPSPLRDDGYDIADYYQVNPSYGTIDDFKELLDEAHKRNLKVITELVINHTSDQHPWFQRARKAEKGSAERDFYVWSDDDKKYSDVRIIFQDYETSNWTWDPVAQQFYWHRFFHHQPDLNYDNPQVQEEIFKVLDYWCNMGVDGFRLDAVPYLFEREGTNGENLPETHAFLKKLRKHMDDHYPGTLFLAEANMWPEDSASYFGNGDECHMNYHFPVMPRIFMSLQMEDRYPIMDIFDQTPEIPESCQWAIFLRNHDELTLEMVTDEERDYMYRVYVKDPKARINLGIRHRLAPLMDNNRRKIELINYLLFSLPGTPVLYYGDEIGMGDNFYLGDRDGVRTPMQWNGNRNAGFSEANPQRLYLPVIMDPDYHYESVNVEMQQRHGSSLLSWTRRMIAIRKKYPVFGRGDMKFISCDNPKVLAFTRTYKDQTILVLANLSKYAQPAHVDLSAFKGRIPAELFSSNKYPAVNGESYFFSLSPFDCHWFVLEQVKTSAPGKDAEVQQISLHQTERELSSLLNVIENDVLPMYLKKVRWFGGKGRVIQNTRIVQHTTLPLSNNNNLLILFEVSYNSGLPEYYQLMLATAFKEEAQHIKQKYPTAVLATMNTNDNEGIIYDAIYSEWLQQGLLRLMSGNKAVAMENGNLQFSSVDKVGEYMNQEAKISSRVLSAEQSNTSITYGNRFFLKLYRKVDKGLNPDTEIIQFLSSQTEFTHIPVFAGAMEWKNGNETMVLGMMQEMVGNEGDAWTFILDKLKVFNEKALEVKEELPALEGTLVNPVSYEEMPEQLQHLIDAALAEQVELLGVRTAELHLALASDSQLIEFRPEPFSLHYQRSLFASFQTLLRVSFQSLADNKNRLPDEVKAEAERLADSKKEIAAILQRIYRHKLDVVKIRTHGDYHLGQVLVTGNDFVIIDFEGEPARTHSERRLKRSPLRDVAGMLRSFHYAAYAGLFLSDRLSKEDIQRLLPFAEQWYHYISGFFLRAYLQTVKGSGFVPNEEEDLEMLLQTFIMEKAVYELNYELNNRPNWVMIPLRGISAILDTTTSKNK